MARHSKLVIFRLALQGVSQYLGHLITTDTFLRLYTRDENGSRVTAVAPGLSKQVYREPRLANVARESQGMQVTCYNDCAKVEPWPQLVENRTDYSDREPRGIGLGCKHTAGLFTQ